MAHDSAQNSNAQRDSAAVGGITRRDVLSAGALGLTALMTPRLVTADRPLDLNDPWDRLTALAKLRGDVSGKMCMWWMSGVRYGVVDDIVKPLFGMMVGSFITLKPVEGKGFELNMLEMSYFTDIDTGKVIDTLVNPYNGAVCEIPEQRLGPYPVLMTPAGVILPDDPMFGDVDLTTQVGPAIVNGNDVWLRDDSSVKVDSDHPMMGKHIYNEILTYRGYLDEINNPDLTSARCDISFQSLTSWRHWFKAEGVGGHTTARATGNKIHRVEDFPPAYLAAARERHPDIIADPLAALEAPPRPQGG